MAALTTSGVMTWTEAKATPIRDINVLNSILIEWEKKRQQARG